MEMITPTTKEYPSNHSRSQSNITRSVAITQEKLIINYNKLKAKYEHKVKENKFLKERLDSAIEAIKTFDESYKSIVEIHNQVKEWINNIKMPSTNQTNHDFSTSHMSHTTRQTNNNKAQEVYLMNTNTNNPNNNLCLLKKLDEFEVQYQEMSKNFNNLVTKYKMLKEDKLKIEDSSLKILTRYSQLEKQHDETIQELYSRYEEIKRYKEVDKCLVDFTLNSFMLKNAPRDNRVGQNVEPGIKCEPIPTFAKFLANKK